MPPLPPLPGARAIAPRDLVEAADDVFAASGPLERAFNGYEPRPGQRRLATEVARVFRDGGTLVAEAGTGIGKTLAYLVPAVLSGKRVVISTGTRTLQDQVFYKDIPALAGVLGKPIRAAYMKGRTNYLCLHRFERLQEAGMMLASDEQQALGQIAEWAKVTETGDRAEVEDLPEDLPLWTELTATSDQCLGRECPQFANCFVTRMRDRAAEAMIVIVNHHLLCADAAVRQGAYGEVIPSCDLAVIDEAHQLEDIVTHYFGVSLSPYRFEELLRDAASVFGRLRRDDADPAPRLSRASDDLREATRRLFDHARHELRMQPSGDRLVLDADAAERLQGVAIDVKVALDRLAAIFAADRDSADAAAIATRARDLADAVGQVLAAGDSAFVRYIETRGRGIFLRSAPIEVAAIVRDHLIGDRAATVLTSATLTVEASFAYALGRLGVPHADTLRVPSEFDYRSKALLYLPPEMPDPRSPEFNAAAAWAIGEILERTQGRAFVLFTSYSALNDVYARLQHRLSWPMLVQGTASRTALLRDFRATPHAVLFATSSFWQGVDVAGDALSCVIVDRLPFASPGDPLVAARMAATQARGGHAFHDYQVPLATLALQQGLGRLLRTHSDRGVLAVLDPRITRMSYGRRFLSSLPPARITDDLADVERFFGGGAGLQTGSG